MFLDIKKYADEFNVPIIEDETKEFIINLISDNSLKNIFEIGSAIGYSALVMASVSKDIRILTIERNVLRYNTACLYFERFDIHKQIEIINVDALEAQINEKSRYDLIFIDAAKAQYQKFFERYNHLLDENGFIVIDNIDFHGFVDGTKITTNRNTRQLARKIKEFRDWIKQQATWHTEYFDVGDGILVIKRKI